MINSLWLIADVTGNDLGAYNNITVLYDSLTIISHIGSSISDNIATHASPN